MSASSSPVASASQVQPASPPSPPRIVRIHRTTSLLPHELVAWAQEAARVKSEKIDTTSVDDAASASSSSSSMRDESPERPARAPPVAPGAPARPKHRTRTASQVEHAELVERSRAVLNAVIDDPELKIPTPKDEDEEEEDASNDKKEEEVIDLSNEDDDEDVEQVSDDDEEEQEAAKSQDSDDEEEEEEAVAASPPRVVFHVARQMQDQETRDALDAMYKNTGFMDSTVTQERIKRRRITNDEDTPATWRDLFLALYHRPRDVSEAGPRVANALQFLNRPIHSWDMLHTGLFSVCVLVPTVFASVSKIIESPYGAWFDFLRSNVSEAILTAEEAFFNTKVFTFNGDVQDRVFSRITTSVLERLAKSLEVHCKVDVEVDLQHGDSVAAADVLMHKIRAAAIKGLTRMPADSFRLTHIDDGVITVVGDLYVTAPASFAPPPVEPYVGIPEAPLSPSDDSYVNQPPNPNFVVIDRITSSSLLYFQHVAKDAKARGVKTYWRSPDLDDAILGIAAGTVASTQRNMDQLAIAESLVNPEPAPAECSGTAVVVAAPAEAAPTVTLPETKTSLDVNRAFFLTAWFELVALIDDIHFIAEPAIGTFDIESILHCALKAHAVLYQDRLKEKCKRVWQLKLDEPELEAHIEELLSDYEAPDLKELDVTRYGSPVHTDLLAPHDAPRKNYDDMISIEAIQAQLVRDLTDFHASRANIAIASLSEMSFAFKMMDFIAQKMARPSHEHLIRFMNETHRARAFIAKLISLKLRPIVGEFIEEHVYALPDRRGETLARLTEYLTALAALVPYCPGGTHMGEHGDSSDTPVGPYSIYGQPCAHPQVPNLTNPLTGLARFFQQLVVRYPAAKHLEELILVRNPRVRDFVH